MTCPICEQCGEPIPEDELVLLDDGRMVTLHRVCVSEWEADEFEAGCQAIARSNPTEVP